MNASHAAGAALGALIGTALAALGTRVGLHLTHADAAGLGVAAVTAGFGVGHAIGQYGIAGVASILWRGSQKPTATQNPLVGTAVKAPLASVPTVSPSEPPTAT